MSVKASKNVQKKFKCDSCNIGFQYKFNLTTHIREKHAAFTSSFRCQHCKKFYLHKRTMIAHMKKEHSNIKIESETPIKKKAPFKIFKNFTEFEDWKYAIEDETFSRFVLTERFKSSLSLREVYSCHRSGVYTPKGLHKRNIKKQGSYKIGNICQAKISTKVLKNGEIEVSYDPTHYGHGKDLQHLFLRNRDREKIAQMIGLGMSYDDIIESLGSQPLFKKISKKTLTSIKASFIPKEKKDPIPRNERKNRKEEIIELLKELESYDSEEFEAYFVKVLKRAKSHAQSLVCENKINPFQSTESDIENVISWSNADHTYGVKSNEKL